MNVLRLKMLPSSTFKTKKKLCDYEKEEYRSNSQKTRHLFFIVVASHLHSSPYINELYNAHIKRI